MDTPHLTKFINELREKNQKKEEEMKKKKVYLSGPITSMPLKDARAIFTEAEEFVLSLGHTVVNPMKNGLSPESSWAEHMKKDITMLLGCDAICMLPDFRQSEGAKLELNIALALLMDVFQYVPPYGNDISLAEKHLIDIIEEPSRTLQRETIPYRAVQRRSDFILNFENGWELYRTNSTFNKIANMVMNGASEYDVLLDLILYLDKNPLNETK